MIVASCIGYGYIAKYLFKKIASEGVKCIGITNNSEYLNKKNIENVSNIPEE